MSSLRISSWEEASASGGDVNLSIGQPHLSLLPTPMLQHAMSTMVATQDPRHALQYSANTGTSAFISTLASFLTQHYGFVVSKDNLFTTNGCSQAMELICNCFARPGDYILVEEPAYHYAHKIFTDNGLEILVIPQSSEGGIDVDALQVKKAHVCLCVMFVYCMFGYISFSTAFSS